MRTERIRRGLKRAGDFVGRFEFLVEEMPSDSDPNLRAAFERFHYDVAHYNPRPEVRRDLIGLIDEAELKHKAQSFLMTIEKTMK